LLTRSILDISAALCRTIPPFSNQDRFSNWSTNFLTFPIYTGAAIFSPQVLASVSKPCEGNIGNLGSSFAVLFAGVSRRTGGRMENICASTKVNRGR